MLKASTIQLLRFPFSYFLMPVYCFALSFVTHIDWLNAILAFVVIHLLLYPSSNGYNSFMDRDTESIGGVENPMQPTKELYYTTIVMDIASIALTLLISAPFTVGIIIYIACSRLYSYRGIRLKRFPIVGYLIVIFNQGALIFAIVYLSGGHYQIQQLPVLGIIAAAFLIGGFYPITQVYQHKADKEDGVKTISMMLGKRGTFIFCAIMYAIAFLLLFFYYQSENNLYPFLVLQIFFLPVIVYFLKWLLQVWRDEGFADFKHTMRMNMLASTCTNLAFITLTIINQFG